ncbi:MAG TPA: DegT/DnrJ/EryC1/StrS family aminotransferase [Chitinophagaceae bacterium]|nr:DegT/DnrJ/EryC1/StrS family aminotransferase [Chitinophagaceae bacterium]
METAAKKIPITKPSVTELEIGYVDDAIRHGWGSRCYEYIYRFEKEFAQYQGAKYSLATSSCTGAIHIALMALGVKAGDEVILPDITWIASVEPVLYIGAIPVFVDVLPDSWCIDPVKMQAAITSKTKAVIPVHVYGNVCEMNEILAISKKHGLAVLEDAAEGLGSEYHGVKAGSIGDVGVFSFHGTKTISTGEGGMLVTNRQDVIEKARILNDHGRDPRIGKTFWMENYGYKYKMSNLQAAMGCAQIERANELVNKKREIFNWYKELLADLPCQMNPEPSHVKNSYWMPTIVIDKNIAFDREALFQYMKEHNIDSRPFFYPLSSLPMFTEKKENLVAYDIYNRGVNLPSYHDLTREDVEYVCSVIHQFIHEN